MGQVRRRGTVWWIRYYRNGQRFEESARTEKYDVARDLLKTREGDIAKGVAVSAKIGRLKFEDAARRSSSLPAASLKSPQSASPRRAAA